MKISPLMFGVGFVMLFAVAVGSASLLVLIPSERSMASAAPTAVHRDVSTGYRG